jgi:hypothetical protein
MQPDTKIDTFIELRFLLTTVPYLIMIIKKRIIRSTARTHDVGGHQDIQICTVNYQTVRK